MYQTFREIRTETELLTYTFFEKKNLLGQWPLPLNDATPFLQQSKEVDFMSLVKDWCKGESGTFLIRCIFKYKDSRLQRGNSLLKHNVAMDIKKENSSRNGYVAYN